jgi:hypothetical protein
VTVPAAGRRIRIGPGTLVVLAVTGFLFQLCESKRLGTNDLGIYLALGRAMAAGARLADVDTFTHTVPGAHYVNGTWGASLAFFKVWEAGGYPALQMLLTASAVVTVLLVAWGARRASGGSSIAAGAASVIAALLLAQNLGMRPQLFALPLFALHAVVVWTMRPSAATVVLAAVVAAAWTNLHGAFLLVPVLSGAFAAGAAWEAWATRGAGLGEDGVAANEAHVTASRDARWHAATALVALGATLLNPYGPGIYRYVLDNMTISMDRALEEWAPTWTSTGVSLRLAAAVAVVVIACWRTKSWPSRRELPALIAFTLLAVSGIRYVAWLAMLFPLALAQCLPRRESETAGALHPGWGAALVIFFVPQLLILSPSWRTRGQEAEAKAAAQFDENAPIALTQWAAANGIEGRLFNPMEWGGWLAWRLAPRATTFVDIRVWIYPDEVWTDFRDVSNAAPGWEDTLDRHKIDYAMLDRRFDEDLLAPMEASPRWEKVYEDAQGVVYRRR